MNYLIYGIDDYLINKEVEKIIKSEKIEDINISRYDLTIDSISTVIDDALTMSLFDEKKVIIINNCLYFNRVKCDEKDVSLLEDYINNPNPSTIMIIINHNESIDSTKKITKAIKKNGKVIELVETNVNIIVKKLFDDYKIDSDTIKLLISRVGEDIDILAQEVEKLKAYKIEDKKITNEDVIACSTFNIDMDIFKFIDNIINKDKENALKVYYELLKNNEEPIKIIALLASKFRLMYQASTLDKKRLSNTEIANVLGVHAYPVKLAIKASSKYNTTLLLSYIKALANLDEDIKTGKIEPKLGLELFILRV